MRVIVELNTAEDLRNFLEEEASKNKESILYNKIYEYFTKKEVLNKCEQILEWFDEIKDVQLFDMVKHGELFSEDE